MNEKNRKLVDIRHSFPILNIRTLKIYRNYVEHIENTRTSQWKQHEIKIGKKSTQHYCGNKWIQQALTQSQKKKKREKLCTKKMFDFFFFVQKLKMHSH